MNGRRWSGKKRRPWVKWTLLSALVAFLAVAVVGAGLILGSMDRLNDSVKTTDAFTYLDDSNRPQESESLSSDGRRDPLGKGLSANILIVGSDSRSNQEGYTGNVTGMRSDTTMIAHLSSERDRIDVVSIPRDSIVDIPECLQSNGHVHDASYDVMFNAAFSRGDNTESAVACTISTIEQNTGVPIDAYVVVDFNGFQGIVDAVGGIPMNVEEDMVSRAAGLDLEAGQQVLDGKTALAFSRARKFEVGSDSSGSDLGRIERQQALVKALADHVLSTDVLTNPNMVYKLSESALASVEVSPALGSVQSMVNVGLSVSGVSSDDINFMTIPVEPWAYDANRVIWTWEAEGIWMDLIDDAPLGTNNGDTSSSSDDSVSSDYTSGVDTEDPTDDWRDIDGDESSGNVMDSNGSIEGTDSYGIPPIGSRG